MDYLKQFTISLSGLKNGINTFSFIIEKEFFTYFKYDEILDSKLKVIIDLDKSDRLVEVKFQINGIIKMQCDRCLDELDFNLHTEELLIVKLGSSTYEEDYNVLVINEKKPYLDLSKLIYDFIALMRPYKLVHEDKEDGTSGCNPQVTKYLNTGSTVSSLHDSRWDKLNELKNKK